MAIAEWVGGEVLGDGEVPETARGQPRRPLGPFQQRGQRGQSGAPQEGTEVVGNRAGL